MSPMPKLIGHRGLPTVAPENTAASVIEAANAKIEWVELDVTMAGDGSLVMMHDANLALFKQPEIRLADLTAEQLRHIDAGAWFSETFIGEPLVFLADMLNLIKKRQLGLNLEIKVNDDLPVNDQVSAVFRELQTADLERKQLVISSFNHAALSLLRDLDDAIQLAPLFEALPNHALIIAHQLQAASIHCDQSTLSEEQAKHIIAHLPLYCYTVNDVTSAEKLFSWGISGIFSDRANAIDLRELAARF